MSNRSHSRERCRTGIQKTCRRPAGAGAACHTARAAPTRPEAQGLTPAQRAYAIKRRKEIWEALHPSEKGGKTVSTLGGNQQVGFASDTASSAGMTKQAINQHIARAEALGPAINDVIGTSLRRA